MINGALHLSNSYKDIHYYQETLKYIEKKFESKSYMPHLSKFKFFVNNETAFSVFAKENETVKIKEILDIFQSEPIYYISIVMKTNGGTGMSPFE